MQASQLHHDEEQEEDDRAARDEEVLLVVSHAHDASGDEVTGIKNQESGAPDP
jgi:hypothetical protein